ncbi:hypothetical protein KUV85_05235 [Nocardioides panacisoli]|uniref:hypothetical protein n=1 Tax=Nocardioides panacisoli TaxID=627624 RepID=UPI001C626FD1|nr:hypothetical protein [Nocardioides panacisoli]QYJ05091.1 hypothetical protein KUV85_05235 [Nocardioides panacisoli]
MYPHHPTGSHRAPRRRSRPRRLGRPLRAPALAAVVVTLVVGLAGTAIGGSGNPEREDRAAAGTSLHAANDTTWIWGQRGRGREGGDATVATSWFRSPLAVRSDRVESGDGDHVGSAWVRPLWSSGDAVLEVREYRGEEVVARHRTDATRLPRRDWTQLEVPVDSPGAGNRLELRITVDGGGFWQTAVIDDVTLEPVSGAMPPTPPDSPATTAPEPSAPTTPTTDPTQEPTSAPTSETTTAPTEPATTATSEPTQEPTTTAPTGDQVLSNGCAYSDRGIPSCGMYVGASHGGNSDPASREEEVGSRLGVRRTFYRADQVDYALSIVREDHEAGRLPWISFKMPHSWADMADGRGDAWVRDLTQRLAATDHPVWLAFHHEPEGDGDITAWTRMQERLAPMVRSGASNVAFTVILTGWNQFYGEDQHSLENLWPRGVTVDIAGFDIYQRYGQGDKGWTDLDGDYFSRIEPWARSQGVEWAIAETGVTDEAAQVRPDVIERSANQVREHGGIAYTYFDSGLNSAANWVLSTANKVESFSDTVVGSPMLPGPDS